MTIIYHIWMIGQSPLSNYDISTLEEESKLSPSNNSNKIRRKIQRHTSRGIVNLDMLVVFLIIVLGLHLSFLITVL